MPALRPAQAFLDTLPGRFGQPAGRLTHTQRLLWRELYGHKNERGYQPPKPVGDDRRAAIKNALALRQATLEQYSTFLYNHLSRGGEITHHYDYPFSRADLLFARRSRTLPAGCGAAAINVVTHPDAAITRTEGHDHGRLYCLNGVTSGAGFTFVPCYPDVGSFVALMARQHSDDTQRARLLQKLEKYASSLPAPRRPGPWG